jgi:hypothetical protein
MVIEKKQNRVIYCLFCSPFFFNFGGWGGLFPTNSEAHIYPLKYGTRLSFLGHFNVSIKVKKRRLQYSKMLVC